MDSSRGCLGTWAGTSQPPAIHVQLFHLLRFETLEPEMNALAARITAVNDIAEQLLKANPPSKDSIVNTQKQLNHRWVGEGRTRERKQQMGMATGREFCGA